MWPPRLLQIAHASSAVLDIPMMMATGIRRVFSAVLASRHLPDPLGLALCFHARLAHTRYRPLFHALLAELRPSSLYQARHHAMALTSARLESSSLSHQPPFLTVSVSLVFLEPHLKHLLANLQTAPMSVLHAQACSTRQQHPLLIPTEYASHSLSATPARISLLRRHTTLTANASL